MRVAGIGVLGTLALACVSTPLVGQIGPGAGTVVRSPRQPYTAEFKTTNVRLLADGTTITQETNEVRSVDSQGRTMTAWTTTPTSSERPEVTTVSVVDPVAGTHSNWTTKGGKVTVWKMLSPEQMGGCATSSLSGATVAAGGAGNVTVSVGSRMLEPGVSRPKPVREDLGTTTIQGVEARGSRVTTTTPVGEVGNDRPLVKTREVWLATDKGMANLMVREISDDPQMGKRTRELVRISLTEPEMATFLPPEGYEVVNREVHAAACAGEASGQAK